MCERAGGGVGGTMTDFPSSRGSRLSSPRGTFMLEDKSPPTPVQVVIMPAEVLRRSLCTAYEAGYSAGWWTGFRCGLLPAVIFVAAAVATRVVLKMWGG